MSNKSIRLDASRTKKVHCRKQQNHLGFRLLPDTQMFF
jgi:hypothetical protein